MDETIVKQLKELGIFNRVCEWIAKTESNRGSKLSTSEVNLYVLGYLSCVKDFFQEKRARSGF